MACRLAGSSHYLNQCWNIVNHVNWTLGNKLGKSYIEIYTFSFKEMHLKMLSGKWRPFCLGLNVLTLCVQNCFEKNRYACMFYDLSTLTGCVYMYLQFAMNTIQWPVYLTMSISWLETFWWCKRARASAVLLWTIMKYFIALSGRGQFTHKASILINGWNVSLI